MKIVGLEDVYDLALLSLEKVAPGMLPPRGKQKIARVIGEIAWLVSGRQRRKITERLSAALGGESPGRRTGSLIREVFRNRWEEEFSFSSFYGLNGRQALEISGIENLHEAVSRGTGLILWDTPFGKRLLAKVVLQESGFNVCQVHEAVHGGSLSWLGQNVIRKIYRRAEANVVEIVNIQDESLAYLRPLVHRLRQNGILCISAFGGMGHKFVSVNFLGGTYDFATGTLSLARMTGAPIIPIFCFEGYDGSDRLVIEKPLILDEGADSEKGFVDCVSRYAGLVESYVRKYPDQWHRWHRLPDLQPRT